MVMFARITKFAQSLLPVLAAVALSVAIPTASAQEGGDVNDVALPKDEAAMALGKTRFSEKCSGFCHGAGGKGARGPCLICGKFKSGGKNSQLIANITKGIDKTPMGAFGGVLSDDEILAVVAYLREEQKKKEAAQ